MFALLACPACFGGSGTLMTKGMQLAIFALLGVTVVILAAFGMFFIYLMRRARMVAEHSET